MTQLPIVPSIWEFLNLYSFGGASCVLPSFLWMLKPTQGNLMRAAGADNLSLCQGEAVSSLAWAKAVGATRGGQLCPALCCGAANALIWESVKYILCENAILSVHAALSFGFPYVSGHHTPSRRFSRPLWLFPSYDWTWSSHEEVRKVTSTMGVISLNSFSQILHQPHVCREDKCGILVI